MSRSEPLVSVMMPCFNAERTLPMALASLRAQTYEHWEACVVDDGSTDRTWEILTSFGDRRIRLERSETNRGRGAARQRCLEMAEGDLLSFLDADDWLFPDKLAHQVPTMRAHPEITVLSGACVITDGAGNAVGLTRAGLHRGETLTISRFDRLGPPPLSFPPCIVRMEAARSARFNPQFLRSQDSDFLIQVLLGRWYGVSAKPVYAYSQAEAASLDKTIEGYRYRLECYGQYTAAYPLRSRIERAKTLARMGLYRAAGWLHAERPLIARRWDPPTPDARASYAEAKSTVGRIAASVGGPT